MDKVYCIFERVFHPCIDGSIQTYHVNPTPFYFKCKSLADDVCYNWNLIGDSNIPSADDTLLKYFVVELPVL